MSMSGDSHTVVRGRIDDRAQLFIRQLRVLPALGHAQHSAGGGYLDPVRAVLVALAHSLAGVLDAVYNSVYRTRVSLQVARPAVGRVAVPARGTQAFRCGDDPGARDIPAIDRCAQRYGHVKGVPQVPDHLEPCLARPLRELSLIERVISHYHH